MTTDTCTTEEAQLAQWNYEARFEDVVWDIRYELLDSHAFPQAIEGAILRVLMARDKEGTGKVADRGFDLIAEYINSVLPTVDVDDLVARQLAPDKAARPLQKAETAS